MSSKVEVAAAESGNNKVLPWEIMESILCLLPAKSLGRFRSVSKTFNSLTSNPKFIKSHMNHMTSSSNTSKLILFSYGNPLFYSLDVNHLLECLNNTNSHDDDAARPLWDLMDSFNGLALRTDPITNTQTFVFYEFTHSSTSTSSASTTATELGIGKLCDTIHDSRNGLVLAEYQNNTLLLVNPTTREFWKVPPSPFPFPTLRERASFVRHGLSYHSSTDDYKIVSLSYWDHWYTRPNDPLPDCTDTLVSVYSLRHNSWTRLPNSPKHHNVHHNTCTALVMDGTFLWLASDSTIVAFDIETAVAARTQVYNEFQLPHSIAKHESMFIQLMVVGGKLAVMGVGKSYDLWVMEEYGVAGSWRKVCSLGHLIDVMGHVKPLCLESRWIPLTHYAEFTHDDDEAVVYDLIEKKCRKVRILGGASKFGVGGAYIETLESPKPLIAPSST